MDRLLSLLAVTLIAPSAWGFSPGSRTSSPERPESFASLQRRLTRACADTFGQRFSAWSRLSERDADRIGAALCAEARVLWPFVEATDPEAFDRVAGVLPTERPRAMVLGIATGVARDNSEVLHAVRHALYPSSAMLWRWNDNLAAMREWANWDQGGRMGGVIYAVIDGATTHQINEQIERAKRAVAHATDPSNALGAFTLVIDNRVPGLDLSARVAVERWIDLDPRDCQRDL